MMDTKFNLSMVNRLFYLIDPSIPMTKLQNDRDGQTLLNVVLQKIRGDRLTERTEHEAEVDELLEALGRVEADEVIGDVLYSKVRALIGKKRWFAFVIPSGGDSEIDRLLRNFDLLGYVIGSQVEIAGAVFVLDEVPPETWMIMEVYPALRAALHELIDWPGILLWSPGCDAVFLPLTSPHCVELDIETRLLWILARLGSSHELNFAKMKNGYKKEFPEIFEQTASIAHILHLSDIQIGSQLANRRMPKLKECLENLIDELSESNKIIPVITGNLMENPSELHINDVQRFWQYISRLGMEEPLWVLGDSDVRKDGNINDNYLTAIDFPINKKIVWYDELKLGLVCINSVQRGNLDRGSIGEQQLQEIEYELHRKGADDYVLIVLLHHSPIRHGGRETDVQSFYDLTYGKTLAANAPLEDADAVLNFIGGRSVGAVLHGHESVSLLDFTEQKVPVVGCGQSIGTVSETDGCVYFFMNLVSVNVKTNKVCTRLLAFKKPQGELSTSACYEIAFYKSMSVELRGLDDI